MILRRRAGDLRAFFGIAMADCGWVWLGVAGCGLLWLAVACYGWLWLAMAGCGLLWLAMACHGLPYGLMTFVFDQLSFNFVLAIIKL